jgi:hypothetical protein
MRTVVETDASPVHLYRAGRFIVRAADEVGAEVGVSDELRLVREVGMGLIHAAGRELQGIVVATFRDLAGVRGITGEGP